MSLQIKCFCNVSWTCATPLFIHNNAEETPPPLLHFFFFFFNRQRNQEWNAARIFPTPMVSLHGKPFSYRCGDADTSGPSQKAGLSKNTWVFSPRGGGGRGFNKAGAQLWVSYLRIDSFYNICVYYWWRRACVQGNYWSEMVPLHSNDFYTRLLCSKVANAADISWKSSTELQILV